jgi:hypothetical protein
MNSTSAELGAGGHTASLAQYTKSVQQWVADGLSFDEILRRLAEDLASGRIEHGERQPCNTVIYEEKDGRLYSPTFKCFISDLFEPDPSVKIEGYPEMLARNKQNLLDAEKNILKSGAKEVWVPSPAADYNSDHGVVYRYRKVGNQILMDAIDGPKDVKDLMDFVGKLSGQAPDGIYDKNGTLVGMRTVSNQFVSDVSSKQIIDLLSTRYGDKESALIQRYNNLPHEITDSLKYFQSKVDAAILELRQNLDPVAFQRGDYSSLSKVVESITSELKGYEHGNSLNYNELKSNDLNYQQSLARFNYSDSNNLDNSYSYYSTDSKQSVVENRSDSFVYQEKTLDVPRNNFDSFSSTQNNYVQDSSGFSSSNNQTNTNQDVNNQSAKQATSSSDSVYQSVATNKVTTSSSTSDISNKEISRLLDPIYRIAHQLSKPQSILNKIRTQGWQSWLSLPRPAISSSEKTQQAASLAPTIPKGINPAIENKNISSEQLRQRLIVDRLQAKQKNVQAAVNSEYLRDKKPFANPRVLQLQSKDRLDINSRIRPERANLTQRIDRVTKNSIQIEYIRKQNLTLALSIKEFTSIKRAVLDNLTKLISNNPNRTMTLAVAKLVLVNSNVLQRFLSIQPQQLKNLLQLSRFALQTLLLTQQNQTVRIPIQSLKLINLVLLTKHKTIIDNLAAKYKLDKSLLTAKEIKLLESRKLVIEALKFIKKLQHDIRASQDAQNRITKNLITIDPRLRALLMQLLKLGVLDELLASDEDWLLSLEEVRTQRTKREMRFVTKESIDKIKKLKNTRRTKQLSARIHKDSTSLVRKSTNRLAVKSISQVAANVAPNYELLPSTSMAKSENASGNKKSGQ